VIFLHDLITINTPQDYKLHLASWNGHQHPLDVFVQDKERWEGWNTWRGEKNDFNRKYIFSLIDSYQEKHTWLFGGVYEVLERGVAKGAQSYSVALTDQYKDMIGRLKVHFVRPGRTRALKFENHLDSFSVAELLKSEYSGEAFCGYENINHDFMTLEGIFQRSKSDWKAALQSVKGIYLITDKNNGKRYVGSAYGDAGIWSRWSCYIGNGHGWNDELTKLISKAGKEYARQNFIFSLLEYRPMKTDDKAIIERESYWKEVMLSRSEYGYNKN
jgi:hypothetical protein